MEHISVPRPLPDTSRLDHESGRRPPGSTERLAATLIRASESNSFRPPSKVLLMLRMLHGGSGDDLDVVGLDMLSLSRLDENALSMVASFHDPRGEAASAMLDVLGGSPPADEEIALLCARHQLCRNGSATLPLLRFPAAAEELLRSDDPQAAFRALLQVREHAKRTLLDERVADGERSGSTRPAGQRHRDGSPVSAFDRFDETVERALRAVLTAGHLRAALSGVEPLSNIPPISDTSPAPFADRGAVSDGIGGRVPFWGEGRVDHRLLAASPLENLSGADLRVRFDWLLSRHLVPALEGIARTSLLNRSTHPLLRGDDAGDAMFDDVRLLVDWALASTPPVDGDVDLVLARSADTDLDAGLIRSVLVRSAAGKICSLLFLLRAHTGSLSDELVPLRTRMFQEDLREAVNQLDVACQPDHPARRESWAVAEFFAEFGSAAECTKVVEEILPLLGTQGMWSPGRDRARRCADLLAGNQNLAGADLDRLVARGVEAARLRCLAPTRSLATDEALEVALLGYGPRFQEAFDRLLTAPDLVERLQEAFRSAGSSSHPSQRFERLIDLVSTLTRPRVDRSLRTDWDRVGDVVLLLPAAQFVRRTPKAGFKSWLVPVSVRVGAHLGDDVERWLRFAARLESAKANESVLDCLPTADHGAGC